MDENTKKTATLVYILQAVSILLPPAFIAGVIINYLQRDEVRGTLAESHFRWQIRTFWFSFLWAVVGTILALAVIGFFILIADVIWVLYRIIRGWLALNSGNPMYVRNEFIPNC